jgi:hypothetical protein
MSFFERDGHDIFEKLSIFGPTINNAGFVLNCLCVLRRQGVRCLKWVAEQGMPVKRTF